MRILRVERFTDEDGISNLGVAFSHAGIDAHLALNLPPDWEAWSRTQKIAWVSQQIEDHLLRHRYVSAGEIIFPDLAAPEQAVIDFSQLPGWATWTGGEAEAWIAGPIERGRLPVVAGGTGFYLRALFEGLFEEPELDAERRERLRHHLAAMDRGDP